MNIKHWTIFYLILGNTLILGGCSSALIRLPSQSTPTTAMDPFPVDKEKGVELENLEPNKHFVSIKGFEEYREQQRAKSYWCWATCVSMVLNHAGYPTNQEQVIKEVTGKLENKPGSHREILLALYPEYREYLKKHATQDIIDILFLPPNSARHDQKPDICVEDLIMNYIDLATQNSDDLILSLSRGEPVILGLRYLENPKYGHAYVAYGAVYSTEKKTFWNDLFGKSESSKSESSKTDNIFDKIIKKLFQKNKYAQFYSIHSVLVIDPLANKPAEISGSELAARLEYMITQRLAKRELIQEYAMVKKLVEDGVEGKKSNSDEE